VCLLAAAACSAQHAEVPDGAAPVVDAGLPAPIAASDFPAALDEAFIRSPQTWLDDGAFATKWADMLTSPIAMFGGADSAFHADLASRAAALPGGEVLCHGDPKLDNFGWVEAGGAGLFSDGDFDDAGACPAAADVLRFLVATDLWFDDPALDDAALSAYVDALASPASAVAIDPSELPDWDAVRSDGVAKDTSKHHLVLGGEVQAASDDEIAAITALVAGDARFPTELEDVARDVRTTGGSAGLRRFWLLVDDPTHPETIVELKELATPGTEFGPHSTTYDGPDRFDVLKPFWWGVASPSDEFYVALLDGRFLARDKLARTSPDPAKLSAAQLENMLLAEASLMALRHAPAWTGTDPAALRAWLRASAATLAARWRAAYAAAGGAT
jgi:hypothetical protein